MPVGAEKPRYSLTRNGAVRLSAYRPACAASKLIHRVRSGRAAEVIGIRVLRRDLRGEQIRE